MLFSIEICCQNVAKNRKEKILTAYYQAVRILHVRLIGLEPTRPEPLDPKSSASTNFATSAFSSAKIQLIFQLEEEKHKKLGSCLLFRNFITIFAN